LRRAAGVTGAHSCEDARAYIAEYQHVIEADMPVLDESQPSVQPEGAVAATEALKSGALSSTARGMASLSVRLRMLSWSS
jgi:hypothetical protein